MLITLLINTNILSIFAAAIIVTLFYSEIPF